MQKLKSNLIRIVAITLLLQLVLSFSVVASNGKESQNNPNGTCYFVSSSSGNDSNSGLSEDNAWKTFSNVSSLNLKSGDKVLLKCGDTWLEHFSLSSPKGTKDNPVVISSYGKGDRPKLALFENEVPKYQDEPLMLIENAEGLEIKNLDIGFCGVGIDLAYNLAYNKEYVKIENCHFHDIYGFNQIDLGGITKYPHATGIVVTSGTEVPGKEEPSLIGLYINKCTTYDAGALITYGRRGYQYRLKDLFITNCEMRNNGVYGAAICALDGGYMDNCKIIDCGSRYAPMGSMGIMMSCKNFTIMNTEIAYQQRMEDNPDGGGIDFEHYTYDCDIINCYIHDNSGVGTMFYSSGADASHQNKRIRFISNVFENNNQNVFKPGGAELVSVPLYSLVNGALLNNRYMESENEFAMYMDASVILKGNAPYSKELQGKVWPILDFDEVRDYVINGKPLKSVASDVSDSIKKSQNDFKLDNYIYGCTAGSVIVLISLTVYLITVKIKRKKAKKIENI